MLFSEYMSVIMRIALSIAVFSVFGFGLDAQSPVCEGPPELEKVIRTRPSAGAYDALGAYFGQKQQLTCAISAFESAVRLDPNSWEARFNLSLALLQSEQPARAARELRIAISKRPDEAHGTHCLGCGAQSVNQDGAAIEEFKLALKANPKSVPALDGIAKSLIAQQRYSAAIAYLKDAPPDAKLGK